MTDYDKIIEDNLAEGMSYAEAINRMLHVYSNTGSTVRKRSGLKEYHTPGSGILNRSSSTNNLLGQWL